MHSKAREIIALRSSCNNVPVFCKTSKKMVFFFYTQIWYSTVLILKRKYNKEIPGKGIPKVVKLCKSCAFISKVLIVLSMCIVLQYKNIFVFFIAFLMIFCRYKSPWISHNEGQFQTKRPA